MRGDLADLQHALGLYGAAACAGRVRRLPHREDVNAFFAMAMRRSVDDPTSLHAHNRTLSKAPTGYTYDLAARGVPFLACEFC